MDTLTAATLVFRRRATLERLVLDADLEIGAGGEAVVYEVPDDPTLVAKVYHQPTIERARKLTLMLANPPAMPAGTSIAWPADLLLDPRGFAGFVMPRADGPRLFEFYNPVTRRATAAAFHFGMLHRAGRNLAAAFHALHAAGYVVGDVNESNILVHPADASVTLVDADSFQVPDAEAGTLFRSRVGKAEFTPPELQGVAFTEVDRAPEHDRFGLAVLLFLLLMEGTHPFAMRMEPGADALPVEERIRRGLFPHAAGDNGCHPPRLSPRFDALHPELRALFVRAFVDGHADPAARPAAAEWCQALEAAEAALAECAHNGLHRHAPHLEACPWCERTELLGGRDPFPAGSLQQPMTVAPRPRRVRVAPTPFDSAPPTDPTIAALRFGVRPPFSGLTTPGPASSPSVFGKSGVTNPLVFAGAAFGAMVALGGFGSFLAGLVVFVSLVLLAAGGWRHVHIGTVVLAFCAMLGAGMMATSFAADDDYYYDGPGGGMPVYTDPAPLPTVPEADEVAQEAAPEPPTSMMDVLLGDIHSAPLSEPVRDPGPPPEPGTPGPVLLDATEVGRLPSLINRGEVSRALAFYYQRDGAKGDSVMLWLHVNSDGRVTRHGRHLIRSSSPEATEAAFSTVPYLLYEPAKSEGRPVGVWITQRFVIVP